MAVSPCSKRIKDRFPRIARVLADGAYAGRLVESAEKTAKFVLDIVWNQRDSSAFPFCMALDRGAHLRLAGQLPSPGSGLRDQSSHEEFLDLVGRARLIYLRNGAYGWHVKEVWPDRTASK